MTGLLDDLRVVHTGTSLASAYAANLFADLGADVVVVEPPGGSPLRHTPGHRFLARGTRSVVLDLHADADARVARNLYAAADVVLTSLRRPARERFGLRYDDVAVTNPRLVYGAVTGFGSTGQLRDVKAYEGLVAAKLGVYWAHQRMVPRPGPAFLTVPFASWTAAQALLQGLLAALRERRGSGLGQYVESNLAQSLSALDPWNQANALITQRYPDAFTAAQPLAPDGSPNTSYTYKLLIAATKDGHWLQFSQTQPRLFDAFIHAAGLDWMRDDPEWSDFVKVCIASTVIPQDAPRDIRMKFWDVLLTEVRSRTLAEWQQIFDADPNVFAEVFRRGTDVLHHPQLAVEGQLLTLVDPEVGDVLQPGPLVRIDDVPPAETRSAPPLDADGPELRGRYGAESARTVHPDPVGGPSPAAGEPDSRPLAGVTILELGTFYAAPYGATLLTDLGARVIKIEALSGEPMRVQQAFPEAGALKVLQGKESVALDLASPESGEILRRIAARCDLALCSFRMGVAERLGVGPDDLRRINPRLTYLDAPGFGTLAPYGNRPAFAPTIAAGSGLAMRNAGGQIPADIPDDLDTLRTYSLQLNATGGGWADGVAAVAVGTALALASYLQSRGLEGRRMLTTMLQSCAHCLAEDMVEFADRPTAPTADSKAYGFSALYRLYETADGWVFLAAPAPHEWEPLVRALSRHPGGERLTDPDFETPAARQQNGPALAGVLAGILRGRSAVAWEAELLALDVGCVAAGTDLVENVFISEFSAEHGWLSSVDSPVLGEYPRIGPLVRFSRSATLAQAGCTHGQHTEAVLSEFGYSPEEIADLAARNVVHLG